MKILSTVKELAAVSSPIFKKFIRHPRRLSHLVESEHPWMAKQLLNYASDVFEPFWWGMGIKVIDASDHGVKVSLPFRWHNRLWRGEIHSGAVVGLSEFGLRVFWERHLPVEADSLQIEAITVQKESAWSTDITACVEASSEYVDQVVFAVQSRGEHFTTSDVALYDRNEQRVGNVSFKYTLKMPLALGDEFV